MSPYQITTIDRDVLLFLGGKLGKENDWEDAYQKCSDFAYRDMCRTIKYAENYKERSTKEKDENNRIRQEKTKLKEKVLCIIIAKLLVPMPTTQDEYEDHFYKACEEIIELYKGKTEQTEAETPNSLFFGQVQKWVNMTMKNLYAYSQMYGYNKLNAIFPFMHIPIDSIIIDILADKKTCACDKGIKYGVGKPPEVWSRLKKEHYKDYQDAAKKKINELFPGTEPLRWELQHWSSPD